MYHGIIPYRRGAVCTSLVRVYQVYIIQGASPRGEFRPLRSLTRKNVTEQMVQNFSSGAKQATWKCQEIHAPAKKKQRMP